MRRSMSCGIWSVDKLAGVSPLAERTCAPPGSARKKTASQNRKRPAGLQCREPRALTGAAGFYYFVTQVFVMVCHMLTVMHEPGRQFFGIEECGDSRLGCPVEQRGEYP